MRECSHIGNIGNSPFRVSARVRLLGQLLIEKFCEQHPDARGHLGAWSAEIRDASWTSPHDLKGDFPRASLLKGKRVVFDIRGNRFRLDCRLDFERHTVLVVRLGTHAEYDRWTFP